MASDADRLPLYLAKIAHLDFLLADIESSWRFMPKLFWLCLLAVPTAVRYGFVWGIVVVGFVCALVGVVAYVLGVRRQDYLHERGAVVRLTERLRAQLESRDTKGG